MTLNNNKLLGKKKINVEKKINPPESGVISILPINDL